MRAVAALAALTMACACTPVPHGDGGVPAPQPIPTGACKATGMDDLIGKPQSEATAKEALSRSGARTLRWIAPGMAVTLDYRGDRLNIDTDKDGLITGFHCG